MRLPLQSLPTFKAVAELRNLRAAAERLNVTHSAVSQQIRGLEQQLGFDIFDRRAGRLVLNPAGEVLLESVRAALARLDEGVQAAAERSSSQDQRLRVTMMPSFAQRWLVPRIERWQARHPAWPLDIHADQNVIDLQREGFHVAIRIGGGNWPGLDAEPLLDASQTFFAVGCPAVAERLRGKPMAALANEPLLGEPEMWREWFASVGVKQPVKPVAVFSDLGLKLQAAELSLGIALVRELFVADALRDGRLVRLSESAVLCGSKTTYHFVHPPALRGWAPLEAFRAWLREELEASVRSLRESGR